MDYKNLHSNQRLLVMEMINRGVDVEILDLDMELIQASYRGHKELIMDRSSSIVPYTDSILIGDKGITKTFLKRGGISVPIGRAFYLDEEEYIWEAYEMFECPVVIKPTFGSHGFDVYINLNSKEEVKSALNKIRNNRGNTKVLIEEYFGYDEYRVFVTKENKYAVLHREPAHVVGDSIHNIEELANIETDRRMNPRNNALCPILIDDDVEVYLHKQNKDLNYIPGKNEKIYLRANSNVAVGGLCIDYTDRVHPSVIEISKRILEIFPGLPYIGVDFMSKDITKKQTRDMYRIIEVNSNPGIHMHMRPAIGEARDVASYVVDLIFPETRVKECSKIYQRNQMHTMD